MRMSHAHCVLPGMDDVLHDFLHARPILDLREHKRTISAHLL
jgi:hypothetical protein